MSVKTRPLTAAELKSLVGVLNRGDLPKRLWRIAAVDALCLGTAGRISEVLTMRNRDLFDAGGEPLPRVSRNVLKYRKPTRKTTNFPWGILGKPVLQWYKLRRFYGPDALFIDSTRRYCWRRQRELLLLAGISPERIAFHGLRKTALTRVHNRIVKEAGGRDGLAELQKVQRFAGHARLETTLIYLGIDDTGPGENVIQSAYQDELEQNNV